MKRLNYKHTHVSVEDGSPAMVIAERGDRITLVNEDGYWWTDPADKWRAL